MESGDSLPRMLPTTPGDELSQILVLSIAQIINTSSMSSEDASKFMDWLNYNSPVSHINIHHSISSAFLDYQYQHHGAHDDHTFSMTFPTLLSEELCYKLILSILYNIHTFSLPLSSPSDFIDWLTNNSPISPINIHRTLSPSFINALRNQYQCQYPINVQPPFFYGLLGFLADETSEYEDMLDLQEQIGHVNVGLSEKTISKNLKTSVIKDEEEGDEICVICQDEYILNDTIGTLHCGHVYHANCIKQWLLQTNVCPICKSTALLV